VAQVVECLLCKFETQSSIPSPAKINKKRKEKKGRREGKEGRRLHIYSMKAQTW
jgi:hypothetical protein